MKNANSTLPSATRSKTFDDSTPKTTSYDDVSLSKKPDCKPLDGWPTWPFNRLTPWQMNRLVKRIKQQQINEMEDALW
jgi:hypothetical protein